MKRLLATVFAVSLAGSVAASVGFEFGANFFKPSAGGAQVTEGQNFLVNWQLDNDLALGVYTETSDWAIGAATGTLTVSAIQVAKGVMKGVNVALNIGSGNDGAGNAALIDVLGSVTILSGSGEKVKGSLKGVAAARFCNATPLSMDGVNLGLAVGLEF